MAASEANGEAEMKKSLVPDWLKSSLFEGILKESVPGFKSITDFKVQPAVTAGENYATLILRIEIIVELENGSSKTATYMMKTPHENEISKQLSAIFNMFAAEAYMYSDILPDFEQLYRDAGVEVKFHAQLFKLDIDHDNVLLEDLRPRGFKNTNRLEGLDMDHTKSVLKKLSQWHAASAVRFETKGKYNDSLVNGFLTESGRPIIKAMVESVVAPLLQCLPTYEGHEAYFEAIKNMSPNLTDIFFNLSKIDPNEFNVLNHGDCWSNNIMFQYDAFGKIKETYFIDFQTCRYGTPAADLYYFLLSSTKLELKVKQFEYFIKFYHDNLVENLILLKYPKKLPSLKDLHIMLYKYSVWGYLTVSNVMGAVLLDPTEDASLETFMGDSDSSTKFKLRMFSNDRYRKHMEVLLPWLYNRGAMEF